VLWACALQVDPASTDNIFVRVFDKAAQFVLDTLLFSPVIYISYEGGLLSPPVVTIRAHSTAELPHSKEE